jgi:uncharacterized iron-regulated protein
MRRFVLVFFVMTIVAAGLSGSSFSLGSSVFFRISDKALVDLSEVLHDLKNASLVFVGELHDQKDHHELQLAVIRGLNEAGVPVAVGLEMFRAESQVHLDGWVLGLNVPREITRQVAQGGFTSLTPEQIGELPEVSCDVGSTYMEFIRRSFGQHPHGNTEFTYFCEAQIVWDTAMAWYLLKFLEANPKRTVVVLAGNGHAWKRGIPEQIRRRSSAAYRVILPEEPERLERENVSVDDLDYLWLKR